MDLAPKKYPECGDLIEISRRGVINYQHWALYVGGEDVVHLVREPEDANAESISERILVGADKATVKREKLKDVAGQDKYCFKNHLDLQYKPRPIQDIMKDANRFLEEANGGKRFPYNLGTNNCEHFVTLLRYGVPQSQQVKDVVMSYVNALIAAAVVFGIKAVATRN